jgi:hypothetical protein
MRRSIIGALFAALLLLGGALPVCTAQPLPSPYPYGGGWRDGGLSGRYVNTSNGGTCEVYRQGRDYVFVNENGTPARFTFAGPDRLRLEAGDWNPDTVATVERNRYGRPVLRFKEPGNPAGLWVKDE